MDKITGLDVLERIPQPIVIISLQGKILYANELAKPLMALELRAADSDKTIFDYLDPRNTELAIADLHKILALGEQIDREYQILTADGKTRWILAHGNRIQFEGEFADLVTLTDLTEEKAMHELVSHREKLLNCAAKLTHILNAEPKLDNAINQALALLGNAIGIDRTYIFANSRDETGNLMMSQRYEWTNSLIEAQINNPELQNLSYAILSPAILNSFTNQLPFFGIVREMDPVSRGFLEPQGILSIILFPLFVHEEFWGFVGFDDCHVERDWHDHEIDILKIMASSISNAIEKRGKEQALLASESKYKQLYSMLRLMCDTMPDMIWAKDVEKKFLFTNKAVCENLLCAVDTDEPIGKNDMFFALRERATHPENPDWDTFGEMCIDSDAVVMANKQSHQFYEYGNIRGKFLYLDVRKAPMFDDQGNFIGTVGSGRDITEIKKTEDELIRSESRNRALLDSIPDTMFLFNREGRFMDYKANADFELYVPPEVFLGKIGEEVLPEHLTKLTREKLAEVDATGKMVTYEYSMRLGDKLKHFESRLTLCGKDEFLAIVRDITASKIAREELINAKEKAEESDKLKSAFLANLSHEIRTPMNGILGFADLLNDPQLNITERDSYIQVINKCSKQLLNIITDIVDISKIETNQVQIKLGAVKLSQLMESLYQAFYLKIAGMADLQFEYIMTPDTKDLGIITDEVKLQQILSNLLENAFKYTESGSIRYGCKLVDGEIEFFVSDTGIGIAEADHQVVFDRFRQAENHLVRKHGGVGLGLAICKAYVEMLGGKMRLQSQLYQGTTFVFDIPCRPTDIEVTEHHASGGGSHDFGSRTILVAEDDETNYNYIRAALKSTGVTLIHAWNGEEAIALYQQNPQIELVIMDIRMPLLNGFEATVRLKEIQPQLPILAMTAYAYEDEKQKALQAGCSDYLAKPVSLNILLETLRKYLS